jgi:hypothetical protein
VIPYNIASVLLQYLDENESLETLSNGKSREVDGGDWSDDAHQQLQWIIGNTERRVQKRRGQQRRDRVFTSTSDTTCLESAHAPKILNSIYASLIRWS